MRRIDYIVVHISWSSWGTAEVIEGWHLERGFKDIGYHFVVEGRYKSYSDWVAGKETSPRIVEGRPIEKMGAHVKGLNRHSIGICWIGKTYKDLDDISVRLLVEKLQELQDQFPSAKIVGHCELDPTEKPDCPGISVSLVREAVICRNLWLKSIS